ncbi:MAG: hypothetical protein ACOC3V_01595 [bacterium]
MISFTDYLKKYELFSFAFKYIINNNIGAYNPYHSTFHLIDVFTKCMEISHVYKLPEKDILELGLAALFHDFNHSGGRLKDYENIELALTAFNIFYNDNIDKFNSLNKDNIIELIKITEYPHKRKPSNVKEMILIDSDMIQCYNKNWFLNVITGFLMKEIGMDIKDAINNQIKYIKGVNYYTEYANSIHTKEKDKMLNNLNYFKNIYK